MKLIKKTATNFVLFYLRFFARVQLAKNSRAVIIGITGSAGKTSTRQAVAQILTSKGKVKESKKANSETGIPLNILGIFPSTYTPLDWIRMLLLAPLAAIFNWERFDYYVVEMGIDSPRSPKNMDYLLKIIRPHVAVVLNSGLVHGAAFDYLVKDRDPMRRQAKIRREIAKEKIKLAVGVAPSGIAIVNMDDPHLKSLSTSVKARLVTLGKNGSASFKLGKPRLSSQGFNFTFSYQGKTHQLAVPEVFDDSYIYTFGAALAVGAALGIPPEKSIQVLASYLPPAGRMRKFRAINSSQVLDSSYNASPDTMEHALEALAKIAPHAHKIAVLGDMRELGQGTKYAHKHLAKLIATHASQAILFGPATAKYTYPLLQKSGFPVRHFTKMSDLISFLKLEISAGSWILIKGSQNTIFLERAVEAVLADLHDASSLCRRGKLWDKIRQNTS